MNQKKNQLLSFTRVVLVLSLIIISTISHAGSGNSLVKAAYTGNFSKVQILLAQGAKIDHQAKNGTTALLEASLQGHEEITRTLLAKGAKVIRKNLSKGTAI